MMKKAFVKMVACYVMVGLFAMGVAPRAYAGLAVSEAVPSTRAETDLQAIQKVLEHKMVRERLAQLGLSQDEVNAKLRALNEEQIHQMATTLDNVTVGGDGFEVLVVLLLVGILVGIWLHVTGKSVLVK